MNQGTGLFSSSCMLSNCSLFLYSWCINLLYKIRLHFSPWRKLSSSICKNLQTLIHLILVLALYTFHPPTWPGYTGPLFVVLAAFCIPVCGFLGISPLNYKKRAARPPQKLEKSCLRNNEFTYHGLIQIFFADNYYRIIIHIIIAQSKMIMK